MSRYFLRIPWMLASLLALACSSDPSETPPTMSPTDAGTMPMPGVTLRLRYHRTGPAEAANYTGWKVNLGGDAASSSVPVASVDDFGAIFEVDLPADAQSFSFQFTDDTVVDPATPITVDVADAEHGSLWFWHNGTSVRTSTPAAIPAANEVLFYYDRPDGAYDGFVVYTWGGKARAFSWPMGWTANGVDDDVGAYYLMQEDTGADTTNCAPEFDYCFIIQNNGAKDPPESPTFNGDRKLLLEDSGNQLFLATGDEKIYTCPDRVPGCELGAGEVEAISVQGARAHLVTSDTLAWSVGANAARHELRYSPTADISLDGGQVSGGTAIELTSTTLSPAIQAAKPHLSSFGGFSLGALNGTTINEVLRGQVLAIAYDAGGAPVAATQVQLPGALDDLYAYDGSLGLDFSSANGTVRVWAPTAQTVRLEVFDENLNPTSTVDMTRDDATGVWSRALDAGWYGGYYRFEVKVYHPVTKTIETFSVTDPYSTSLSTNSTHTQIIDVMNDAATKPPGWDAVQKPALDAPEDISIYELHVRDFSVADPNVADLDRGKFTAFLYTGDGGRVRSDGMTHLLQLQQAGLTHVHLLPAFDIATVDEDPNNRVEITDGFDRLCDLATIPAALCAQFGTTPIRDALATFGPADLDQQMILGYMRDLDGFNWGYDPFHYSAPEGSYATNAMGSQRVLEFRQMVQTLAENGLRTALDVVYNHTNAAGINEKSVLDKVVPWYYHRLNPVTGSVINETCCQDTATENRMMEKLMIDSVVFWAKAYKLDAFRFDLMGYHLKSHMVALRAALDALTVPNDGVDGSEVYVYGEGWNPGRQGDNRGENATQITLDNTGIGTFSDRLRDAARGGGPFDNGQQHVLNQGFINGLAYDPNTPSDFGSSATRSEATDLRNALERADWIRVGLAGALRQYPLQNRFDTVQNGADIRYNGAIGGYTSDPEEVVTYVEKHDNETLFDISTYKNPLDTSMADRVRVQNIGISLVALAQGVPFFHAGMDLLRSKSMDRNSFNSGDYFNEIDWTGATTNFKKGLPQQGDNANNRTQQEAVLQSDIDPTQDNVLAVSAHMQQMLSIRRSSPLFRLRTADEIIRRVAFYAGGTAQTPGVIAMGITDGTACANTVDLDANYDAVFVVFNANDEQQEVSVEDAAGFTLHPAHAASQDDIVKTASFAIDGTTGTFTVPARTTAVFVATQGAAQGAGLPCNPHAP